MKRCLLILAFPALLAAAPSPLVVGSVRDQFGAPITGAVVTGGGTSARTDAQGTFALPTATALSVGVTCPYCRPLTVAVAPNEPVVAIVHRYDALVDDVPSDRDITYLPYAHVESDASLRPFTVLETSSHLLPGASISDRGLTPRGSLVLDGGIPLYDVATNESPFVAFPGYTVQHVVWQPPSDAFTYGDLAGGGTLFTDTHSADTWSGIGAAGTAGVFRAGETSGDGAWSTAFSQFPGDERERADGTLSVSGNGDAFGFRALASQDRAYLSTQTLDSAVDAASLNYESARENRVDASVDFNGGSYAGTSPSLLYSARWSDVQAQAGVTTNTPVQFFANAGVRASSGYYSTSNYQLQLTAGAISQTRIDAGLQTSGDRYDLRLGAGGYDFFYSGGSDGAKTSMTGGVIVPGFTGSYELDPHWTLEVQAGGSFTLPTVAEAFVEQNHGPGLPFDRNRFVSPELTYGDLHRFRASLVYAAEGVSGLDNGTVHSEGVSAAWQFAPAFSVRAWLMHSDIQTLAYDSVFRFGANPQPATVGAYWITYESAGLRVDTIYRRDLLDYRIDPHFDAALSVPVARRFRAFASTERYAGTRSFIFGFRLQTP